jgi:hypothetical protein
VQQVFSILLMVFAGIMFGPMAAMLLTVEPSSSNWWEWKLQILAIFGALGGVPMAIGTLLRPTGFRIRDLGIAMLSTTV